MGTTYTHKAPQPVAYDVEDADALYETRMPSSVRRYRSHETADDPMLEKGAFVQRRRASLSQPSTHGVISNAVAPSWMEIEQERKGIRLHSRRFPLAALLIGMVVAILLIMTCSTLISWWQGYHNDLVYGRPRTYQFDAVVGHDDSPAHKTHFICLNLNGHVQIIEIPGGDTSQTRVFSGPTLFGQGQNLTPVTGDIVHEDGRYDLVIHIQNQQIVYINDGTTFHPQQ